MRKLDRLLDEDVRGLVRRASVIEAAPDGTKSRVLSRVEALVASSSGERDGPGPAGDVRASSIARRPSALGRALTLGASFALGGLVGAFWMYRALHASPHVEVAPIVSAGHDVATATVAVSPAAPATASGQPLAPLNVPSPEIVGPTTSAARPRTAPLGSGASPVLSSPTDAPDGIDGERVLLDDARGAIEREDGAAALAATAEHARRYPRGVFVQEREAIAVRALVLLGRVDEARARVDRFEERFPDSLLRPALEANVGLAPAP
jgi:hypothetical protein